MQKTIILDAGHSLKDPGAKNDETTEAKEAMKVRDLLVPLLRQDFEVVLVPDNLNLRESTIWINSRYKNLDDGLAFAIHFNASSGGYGAETFYYAGNLKSQKIAQTIIDKYCALTRFRNRGAKPDTSTRFKEKGLGWIRDPKPWSCLIELCFIDSKEDMDKLRAEYNEIVFALYESICAVYGIKPTNLAEEIKSNPSLGGLSDPKSQIKTKLAEISDLIDEI